MQQRRRISSTGASSLARVRSNPVLASMLVIALAVTAIFGGNHVIQNTNTGFGEVLNESSSFADGENVVIDDPAIATQGEDGEVHRTVKEFRKDVPFSMFALQWDGDPDIAAFVRAEREDGSWSEWYDLELVDEATADGRNATELIWIEPTTRVQVNVSNVDLGFDSPGLTDVPVEDAPAEEELPGLAPLPSNYGDIQPVANIEPTGMEAVFIDGGYDGGAINPTATTPGMPNYVSRNVWGGDIVGYCNRSDAGPTKGITVHHTAGSNNYSPAQSISRIRGYWTYHAKNLGWCDIGYHSLVDKYGTLYEGRQGGLESNVMGAHVGGFNSNTWSISAMGNYETAPAPAAMVQSIGEMAGWRAAHSGFSPTGSNTYRSGGFTGSRFPAGTYATLPNIHGHRDFHYTTCPGGNLYSQFGTIRNIAEQRYSTIRGGLHQQPTTTTATTTPTLQPGDYYDEVGADGTTTRYVMPDEHGNIPQNLEPTDQKTVTAPADENRNTLGNLLGASSQGDENAMLAVGLSAAVVIISALIQNGTIELPGGASTVGEVEVFQGLTVSQLPPLIGRVISLTGDSEVEQKWSAINNVFGPVLGASKGVSTIGVGGPTGDLVSNLTGSEQVALYAETLEVALFENGFIIDSEEVGTRALWGAIADAWVSRGMDAGPLGLPTTDQYFDVDGTTIRMDFQGGYITYTPSTNHVDVQTH